MQGVVEQGKLYIDQAQQFKLKPGTQQGHGLPLPAHRRLSQARVRKAHPDVTIITILNCLAGFTYAQTCRSVCNDTDKNTFLGSNTGIANVAASGTLNTFVGFEAGKANTSGDGNVFLGMYTGLVNTTGSWNAFVGRDAGKANTSGRENAFLGVDAGASNSSGIQNTALGGNSLRTNSSGSYNVCVGFEAGRSTSTSSSSNVFLGYQAGYAETGSNKFYIDNANNTVPFMYGDFTAKALCINTKNYQEGSTVYKLSVGGKIRADEVKVYTGWADYVFADDYKLRPLKEVEAFIQQHKHLPEVPSAQEVEENGVLLGEMNATLLKKIEELTLYMIEMEKKAEKLEETVAVLQKNVAYLQQENAELKEKDHR